MWTNLNDSLTAIQKNIKTNVFGSEADDDVQQRHPTTTSRPLQLELEITRGEVSRLRRLLRDHDRRLASDERPVETPSDSQTTADDDFDRDDPLLDFTSVSVRLSQLEEELRKVSADREHWRALASTQKSDTNSAGAVSTATATSQCKECHELRQQCQHLNNRCSQLSEEIQELDAEHELAIAKLIQHKTRLENELKARSDGNSGGQHVSEDNDTTTTTTTADDRRGRREEPEGAPLPRIDLPEPSSYTNDGVLKASIEQLTKERAVLEDELRNARADVDRLRSRHQLLESSVADNERLKTEMNGMRLECQRMRDDRRAPAVEQTTTHDDRLNEELSRLRAHLVVVEDNYTAELLQASEKEAALMARVREAEETLEGVTREHRVCAHEMRSLATDRDIARRQLSQSEDRVAQSSASLANLQLVIEHIQKDNDRKLLLAQNSHKEALEAEVRRTEEALERVRSHESRYADTVEALGAASRLAETLDTKEHVICQLRAEAQRQVALMDGQRRQMDALHACAEGKVDKQVVKSLVFGFFVAPPPQRPEVSRLLARVLDFNAEELEKAGIEVTSQNRRRSQTPQSGHATDDSLSQKFVRFLENESKRENSDNETRRDLSRTLLQSMSSTTHPHTPNSPSNNPFLTTTTTMSSSSRHSSSDSLSQLLITPELVSHVTLISSQK